MNTSDCVRFFGGPEIEAKGFLTTTKSSFFMKELKPSVEHHFCLVYCCPLIRFCEISIKTH